MIEHVPELIGAGLTSFKIEGRVKSEFYVATVVGAYRRAIDACFADPAHYQTDPAWMEELKKVSHRGYTTGFYFGRPGAAEQNYASSAYIREYDMIGVVIDYNEKTGMAKIVQKNRFFVGDTVEFLRPVGKFYTQKIREMTDENGVSLTVANRPQSIVYVKTEQPVEKDTFLRKFRGENA